jgi:hypothetical protein
MSPPATTDFPSHEHELDLSFLNRAIQRAERDETLARDQPALSKS